MTTAAMNVIPEEAHLAFKQGNSDKVYSICLAQCETGWTVLATWGRRGSTLNVEAKVERAEYEPAKKIYDRVLREKLAKGYQYVAQGKPTQSVPGSGGISAIGKAAKLEPTAPLTQSVRPASKDVIFSAELLTRCTEREVLAHMRSPRYWFQLKRDGRRLTVQAEKNGKSYDIWGYNKLGQVVQLDPALHKAVESLCDLYNVTRLLMDGEWEASGYHVWDLLELNSDLRRFGYQQRFETLETLLKDVRKMFFLTRCAKTTTEKEILFGWAKANRAEGICVKSINAPYCGGRNGSHLKHKFETTASFIVGPKPQRKANDGHRSVALYVVDNTWAGGERWKIGTELGLHTLKFAQPHGLRFVATVKIPDCFDVPKVGAVLDARYLYAHKNGGIVQPCVSWDGHALTLRTDVEPKDCVVQQLKLKQGHGEEEEAA